MALHRGEAFLAGHARHDAPLLDTLLDRWIAASDLADRVVTRTPVPLRCLAGRIGGEGGGNSDGCHPSG